MPTVLACWVRLQLNAQGKKILATVVHKTWCKPYILFLGCLFIVAACAVCLLCMSSREVVTALVATEVRFHAGRPLVIAGAKENGVPQIIQCPHQSSSRMGGCTDLPRRPSFSQCYQGHKCSSPASEGQPSLAHNFSSSLDCRLVGSVLQVSFARRKNETEAVEVL